MLSCSSAAFSSPPVIPCQSSQHLCFNWSNLPVHAADCKGLQQICSSAVSKHCSSRNISVRPLDIDHCNLQHLDTLLDSCLHGQILTQTTKWKEEKNKKVCAALHGQTPTKHKKRKWEQERMRRCMLLGIITGSSAPKSVLWIAALSTAAMILLTYVRSFLQLTFGLSNCLKLSGFQALHPRFNNINCHVGEYPMTGTSAAEKETPGSRADKLHRGRNVVLAFTMQVALVT